MKILVFLHGTTIMHRKGTPVSDYANYVPIGNSVEKLKGWQLQGAEIFYLSSHENKDDLEKDKLVLEKYGFPKGEIYWRQNGESYADIAQKLMPDILIEDDCESIGGEKEMVYTNLKPELRAKIKLIKVKEFGGIDHLPDDLKQLKDYGKYSFYPYDPLFEDLFKRELTRLRSFLGEDILIEHAGSTAVRGMGGKGIIDILIGVPKKIHKKIIKQLQKAGYDFIPRASTQDRLFLQKDYVDEFNKIRRYHIHLTYKNSWDWQNMLAFRDMLRTQPEVYQEYEQIKKKAATEAKGDALKYRKIKKSFIDEAVKS